MRNRDEQKQLQEMKVYMRNTEDQKATATNAYLLLIMSNPEDQKKVQQL